jgi:hypothetical protein
MYFIRSHFDVPITIRNGNGVIFNPRNSQSVYRGLSGFGTGTYKFSLIPLNLLFCSPLKSLYLFTNYIFNYNSYIRMSDSLSEIDNITKSNGKPQLYDVERQTTPKTPTADPPKSLGAGVRCPLTPSSHKPP